MAKIKYPVFKYKKWNEHLCNKICGAIISIFIFIFLVSIVRFISIYIYIGISGIIKWTMCPLILGFSVATFRSLYKGYRRIKAGKATQEEVVKDPADMGPTYWMNYPITLTMIYLLGNYFLSNKPRYIFWAILFVLGFGVDSIFYLITHPGDLFQDLLQKFG